MITAGGAAEELLERAGEIDEISALLDTCRAGAGQALVIEGPAGIGKSRLLAAARDMATSRGFVVLQARGGNLERGHPFGVVRQLLVAPVTRADPDQRRALLADAAALAAPALGLGDDAAPPGPRGEGTASALHGLHWLCANIASEAPVLMAIDDAHWADGASMRFLAYLARRLEDLPMLMAVAWRPGEPKVPSQMLDAILAELTTSVVRPEALTRDGASLLLTRDLGGEQPEEVAAACYEVTGGNPLLVRGIAAELRSQDAASHREIAERVRTMAPPDIARRLLSRVKAIGPDALKLTRALAVLDVRAPLQHVAAIADLDAAPASAAADALVQAGVLEPGRPLSFLHPVVRSVVYDDLGPGERSALHARAAHLLTKQGADDGLIAAQLLQVDPVGDQRAVDVLLRAAQRARADGAVEATVAYATRALDEFPPPTVRREVLHERSLARLQLGDPACADDARAALELSESPDDLFANAGLLRFVLVFSNRPGQVVEALDPTIARLREPTPGLADQLDAIAVGAALLDAERATSVSDRLERLVADVREGGLSHPHALTAAAWSMSASGRHAADDVIPIAVAAAEQLRVLPRMEHTHLMGLRALSLMAVERFDVLERMCDPQIARAQKEGARPLYVGWATLRGWGAYARGDIKRAEADGVGALDASRHDAHALFMLPALGLVIATLVEQGRLSEAQTALDEVALADVPLTTLPAAFFLVGRGRMRIALGNASAGVDDLLTSGRVLHRLLAEFVPLLPWRSEAALALHALGDIDRARELADEQLRAARALGTPGAVGVSLRALGLLTGGSEGVALLETAVAALAGSPARLDQARALVDLGAAYRRAGARSEARKILEEGLVLSLDCGATALAERAREELRASGARPRRDALRGRDALTGSEMRVVRMAAEGMSNPQIAQALFVTRKTVETHLRHAFQKLDVGSRHELADALAAKGSG